MRKRSIVAVLIIVAAAGIALWTAVERRRAGEAPASAPAGTPLYQCAMHPGIVSDRPGTCPICNMRLEPVHDRAPAASPQPGSAAAARQPLFYRHPMRPEVTSPVPAQDEMGMDYVPVYADEANIAAGTVAGRTAFTLSSERQQLIGVTTAVVESRPLTLEIRAVGRVAYDPKLFQVVAEYREALRAKRQIAESPWREAHEGADALLGAAALKLRQQGLSEDQIRTLGRDGRAPLDLLLPGERVWVYAQVYEYEMELVRPGQSVTLTAPATRGTTYTGTVVAVDSILDPATRTARVRIQVPTPDRNLRPESFVQARIQIPLGTSVAVPEDAVLDTGEHQIAFVVHPGGAFEPRALRLGRQAEGYHEVLAGVAPGEQVVTSANFLIDSESRFRAALAGFATAPAAPHAHEVP